MKYILSITTTIGLCNTAFAQTITPAQDSLLQFLAKNEASVREIVHGYNQVSFNWTQFLVTFGAAIALGWLTWRYWAKDKLFNHVKKKTQEAIDNLNNLKTVKILVVSGKNSSDEFLRSFFEEKKFSNVKFKPESGFTPDVIFANNEDNSLDKDAVRKMVGERMVLFYFGKSGSWDYANDTPELSRKINFANSRAQIYGNLMSSVEFLELIKPRITNI